MARLHFVKKARKTNKEAGVKKGESYFWWKFRRGGKQTSKLRPSRSQLTQSEFWGRVFDLQDGASGVLYFDDLESEIDNLKSELEGLRDEQEEKRSNMPEGLQDSGSGELLQERYDAIDECINTLETIDTRIVDEQECEGDFEDLKTQRAQETWSEVTDALCNISCS